MSTNRNNIAFASVCRSQNSDKKEFFDAFEDTLIGLCANYDNILFVSDLYLKNCNKVVQYNPRAYPKYVAIAWAVIECS